MKKYLIPIILLPLLAFSSLVSAETKTFVKEYSYQASEYDSKVSCRALALEQVKRLLLEELGTYLESDTEVKNFQLTKDQIIILTAGIVRTEIIEEKWDGKTYSLKAKIIADPNDVASSIEKLRQDRQKTREMEEMRQRADEELKEIERLRKELEIAKAEKPNLSQYNKAINGLSATDWFQKGKAFENAGNHKQAIEANTRAIELDPKYAYAFNNRGNTYGNLGDYKQAIRDYDRAIELNPKDADAFNNRGTAYNDLGDHRQAIRDYNRAIELDPKDAAAYYNRAIAYGKIGDHRQEIRDYNRAIELNPKYAKAYYNRGIYYSGLGDHQQAISNIKTAARLGDKKAQDFLRSKGIGW